MTAAFILTLWASVPFVGHVENGRLFCNAACVVSDANGVVFVSDGPIMRAIPMADYTVKER